MDELVEVGVHNHKHTESKDFFCLLSFDSLLTNSYLNSISYTAHIELRLVLNNKEIPEKKVTFLVSGKVQTTLHKVRSWNKWANIGLDELLNEF